MGVVFGQTAGLQIEIAGDQFGQFDQLTVEGDIYLDGTLDLVLLGDFQWQANQQLQIIDVAGDRFGEFGNLSEGDLVGNFGRDVFITYNVDEETT